MEKEFCRVRTIKDIAISLAIIVAGFILIALPTSVSLNVTGFLLICTGLLFALVLRSGYKDLLSGELYCKSEKYFDRSLKTDLSVAIQSEPSQINLTEENKGNGVRLDIYYSAKNGKAYTQLFEYIPYEYQPCTEVHEHELCKVKKILGKL